MFPKIRVGAASWGVQGGEPTVFPELSDPRISSEDISGEGADLSLVEKNKPHAGQGCLPADSFLDQHPKEF